MRLPKLEWADAIIEAYQISKNRIERDRRNAFEAAYSRYAQKLSHVSFIWDRLRADTEAHERHLELVFARDKWTAAARAPFTSQELVAKEELEEASKTLSLDYEDFLIHSRILMDRVIFLTQFFLPRTEKKPSPTSFTEHRKFFQNAQNIPFQDDEYAKYICEKTQWYETLLRPYRDDFVVHDTSFRSMGLLSGPTQSPRLIRVRSQEMETPQPQQVWSPLMALRDKYLNKIPGLDNITVNIYELIDFLDSHASMIESADLKTLAEVRRSAGAKLPDLLELANHIQQFLSFFGQHFYGRIREQI
jgi:hypothetical protein